MTPKQAYEVVRKKAKKAGMSITAYCVLKGVSPGTVTRWQTKTKKETITMSVFTKLTN